MIVACDPVRIDEGVDQEEICVPFVRIIVHHWVGQGSHMGALANCPDAVIVHERLGGNVVHESCVHESCPHVMTVQESVDQESERARLMT